MRLWAEIGGFETSGSEAPRAPVEQDLHARGPLAIENHLRDRRTRQPGRGYPSLSKKTSIRHPGPRLSVPAALRRVRP
jgi:hypothetical protein